MSNQRIIALVIAAGVLTIAFWFYIWPIIASRVKPISGKAKRLNADEIKARRDELFNIEHEDRVRRAGKVTAIILAAFNAKLATLVSPSEFDVKFFAFGMGDLTDYDFLEVLHARLAKYGFGGVRIFNHRFGFWRARLSMQAEPAPEPDEPKVDNLKRLSDFYQAARTLNLTVIGFVMHGTASDLLRDEAAEGNDIYGLGTGLGQITKFYNLPVTTSDYLCQPYEVLMHIGGMSALSLKLTPPPGVELVNEAESVLGNAASADSLMPPNWVELAKKRWGTPRPRLGGFNEYWPFNPAWGIDPATLPTSELIPENDPGEMTARALIDEAEQNAAKPAPDVDPFGYNSILSKPPELPSYFDAEPPALDSTPDTTGDANNG